MIIFLWTSLTGSLAFKRLLVDVPKNFNGYYNYLIPLIYSSMIAALLVHDVIISNSGRMNEHQYSNSMT